MATRRGPRPAKDTLTAARHAQAAANIAMGQHYTMCYQCSHDRLSFRAYCDEGWQLIKAVTSCNAAVRHAEDAASSRPVQGTLW